MSYEHLPLERETPLTERHSMRFPGIRPPADVKGHGARLVERLAHAQLALAENIGGFDSRKLLKIRLRAGDKSVPSLDAIPGVEIVSQEAESIVLAFATEEGMAAFESRLTTLARDGTVIRQDLLFVIEDFDHWTAEDRTGSALREQGFPDTTTFMLDVELWPQERKDRREAMADSFLNWLNERGIERLDEIRQPSLVMVRVGCNQLQAAQVLLHRDVRTVDLPPRLGLDVALLRTDINAFPLLSAPAHDAPAIAVLDAGLSSGHSLLGAAVGDAQGYVIPHRRAEDTGPHWHGTFVGGLALYGDVESCIRRKQFSPQLRLFSGKVFADDGEDQTQFVEKAVEEAVRYLHSEYGCRVFNLSYGDLNKIYDGRHVRGLAYTLDRLTRELGILFVVPTGNLSSTDLPDDARDQYPNYLFQQHTRLLDPATSINALTVGGISQLEATRDAQRHPNSIEDHVLARRNQPFPLTRIGPSINGAIKPDVVEHAGNIALRRNSNSSSSNGIRHDGLGVLSLHGGFATGAAFKEDIGTSYAAPQVAHKAARLLAELPTASHNLLRALLGVHARWPQACEKLLKADGKSENRDRLLQLIGYGQVDDAALYRSLDNTVTLLAEESIGKDKHHFYELPLPESMWATGRGLREVAVALAYSPAVRTTRLDYRHTKLWFHLVIAQSLEEVTQAYRRNREEGMGEHINGRWLSNKVRKHGSLQVSRWQFKQAPTKGKKMFVVITRQDNAWSDVQEDQEPYALAVVVEDRGQLNVPLYAQVRTILESRVQLRQRAKVGS